MNLTCPACGNKLGKIIIGDSTIDICQGGCAGIWLENIELKKLIALTKKDIEILSRLKVDPNIQVDMSKTRICPTCNISMVKKIFKIGDNKVTIDTCDQCSGIWLDKGELSVIRNEKEEEVKVVKTNDLIYKLRNKLYN